MNSFEKIYEGVRLAFEGVGEAAGKISKLLGKACDIVIDGISSLDDRKISKRRFCKLLQSFGIQRNEINQIIKNNKKTYTYGRLILYIGGTNEIK